ncbi:MAG: universal stress protein [Opitutales bacterium]|nr:universal stress protein [Opitutales bacterium]
MKKLMVCTDGSGYSNVSCEFASWIASKTGASVDVLYVTDIRQYEMPIVADISGSLGAQPYLNLVSQLQQVERLKVEVVEQAARKTFEDSNFDRDINFIHQEGTLVDRVDDVENNYDIILIGKRGMNSEAAKQHLGSSLERVVRACSKPVLVTSRAFRPLNKILIAYDGSPSSRRALDFVASDKLFEDAKIYVVSVDDKGQNSASKLADEALGKLLAAGRGAEKMVISGPVHQTISKTAEDIEADMLVIGAFGQNRLREFFIGSTTTELLRTKNMPILCMR